MRVRPSPREKILEIVTTFKGVTRSEIAEALGISYWSSRYWLEKLVDERFLRKEVTWVVRPYMRRVFYFKVVPVVKEMVDATIVVYSTCTGKRGQYEFRFQGFYDVDALRYTETGVIDYSSELTKKEIKYCMFDFRLRWNWLAVGKPAPGTDEPVWVETSEFERIREPKGVVCKSLSKVEYEEETYFGTVMEFVFIPTEEDIKKFKEMVR